MRRLTLGPVHDALFALWFVALGADRVSLVDKSLPFILTPFLALTPFVIASEWLRRTSGGRRIVIPGPALAYAGFAAALMAAVVASVTISPEPLASGPRAALLVAQIGGTFAIVLLVRDRENLRELLARASVTAILVYAAFDVVQVAAMFHFVGDTLKIGPAAIHLETSPYGIIPRLSGPVADPNRTGLVLIFMAFAILTAERRSAIRRFALVLAGVLMAFTLSRSTLLALITTLVFYAAIWRPRTVRVGTLLASCTVVLAVAALLVVAPPAQTPSLSPLAPLSERFSGAEFSSGEHLLLLQRGIEEATASVPRLLLGIGYGSSYVVLQDRYPGNKYANFHSLYVTMFAESGVFALALTLVLLGWPMIRGGRYVPVLAGAAVFNVFYQASTEPAFWLIVALAWVFIADPAPKTPRSD